MPSFEILRPSNESCALGYYDAIPNELKMMWGKIENDVSPSKINVCNFFDQEPLCAILDNLTKQVESIGILPIVPPQNTDSIARKIILQHAKNMDAFQQIWRKRVAKSGLPAGLSNLDSLGPIPRRHYFGNHTEHPIFDFKQQDVIQEIFYEKLRGGEKYRLRSTGSRGCRYIDYIEVDGPKRQIENIGLLDTTVTRENVAELLSNLGRSTEQHWALWHYVADFRDAIGEVDSNQSSADSITTYYRWSLDFFGAELTKRMQNEDLRYSLTGVIPTPPGGRQSSRSERYLQDVLEGNYNPND
jgi:hypothetical protein